MKNHAVTASDCLKRWAHWLDGLADHLVVQAKTNHWECGLGLPSGHNIIGRGDDASLAVRNFIKDLVEQIPAPLVPCERENVRGVSLPMPALQPGRQEKPMHNKDEVKRMDTKPRRETIGVTTKRSFHTTLTLLAEDRGVAKAEFARELLQQGLERFECSMETKNPSSLLRTYEQAAQSYEGESEQWSLRLDRPLAKWVRMIAKEFEKSSSQIASFLLAESLQREGLSPIVAAVISTSDISAAEASNSHHPSRWVDYSSTEFDEALSVINSWQRPKRARELSERAGLGGQRDLVCQILQGETMAPPVVLGVIANHIQLPIELLVASFSSNYQSRSVPMFKSTQRKPQLTMHPRSWSDAVKALNLPAEEEQALLALES
ncbi:hypothetical protein ALO46_03272 [Pseudomonas syringae pv. solidagae]|uniref:Uncharacterized protein n=2 Tax=Pseudomonas syringae TaxID=317 RepID=A0A0P9ZVI0_PSESX|nr:hypothetical protein ALO46_03272 [Pseudomonas syringae pv. solidagae]RMT34381.1 hypothetical protein ALP49_04096 [Pseudomonas syringae pv. solidagae]RMT39553.1 hypothetical protein ALP48_00346 [Pseudomonas syringae pv. solidagae]